MVVLYGFAPFQTNAQIELTFTGSDNLDHYVQLHHVVISNITRNWSTTIYYPDTTLTLSGVGIAEVETERSRFSVSQNVPNPFDGTTEVSVNMPYADNLWIDVLDLNGHVVAHSSQMLPSGAHLFRIFLGTPQTYVLNARTRQDKDAVKMVNHGSANANRIEYKGEGSLQYEPLKYYIGKEVLPFEYGDRMRYVGLMAEGDGYVISDTVEQIQENNDIIDLTFSLWTPFVEPRHYIDTTTLFIPGGIFCDGSCFSTKTLHVEDYQNDAVVNTASDIKYVRLNMEHSWIGDLYIRISCPNGQHATIMKKATPLSTSGCAGQIPGEDWGWQDSTSTKGAHFGWYNYTDVNGCDPNINPPGQGWNYCWSSDSTSGYQYACGDGFVYNTCNHFYLSNNPYPHWDNCDYVDSTAVATMNNVYHPDESFDSLIGCPLNGNWTIEILDGYSSDNGYLFDYELVLKEDTVYHYLPAIIYVPKVVTFGISSMSAASVECMGEVTDDGNSMVTERGVCWSTSQNPTINDSFAQSGQGTGVFTASMSNLTPDATYYVRAYAVNSLGIAYGEQKSFTFTLDTACVMPVLDIDGNVYDVVKIGQQCWMRENMKTTHFPDGSEITEFVTSFPYTWTPGRYTGRVVDIFGYLYNWPAAKYNANPEDTLMVQGLCPDGWHLPSKSEWETLFAYTGSQSQYQCNGDAAKIAKALAGTQYWMSDNSSCAVGNDLSTNNATGFSMLPAGELELFNGQCTTFWTSSYQGLSPNGMHHKAHTMRLTYFMSELDSNTRRHNDVLSVRCLRNY